MAQPRGVVPSGSPVLSAKMSLLRSYLQGAAFPEPHQTPRCPPRSTRGVTADGCRRLGRCTAWMGVANLLIVPRVCWHCTPSLAVLGFCGSGKEHSHPPPVPLALPTPLSPKPLQALEMSGQALGLRPKAPPNYLRCPLLNSHFSSPSFSSPSSQGRGHLSGQSTRPAADSLCLYLPQTLDGSSARPSAPPHWFQPLPRSGIPSSSAPGSWTTAEAPAAPRLGCFPLHPWDARGKQGSRDGKDPVAGPCSGVRRHRFCRHRGYNAGIVPLARPHGSTRPGAVHRPWAFPELPGAGEEGRG